MVESKFESSFLKNQKGQGTIEYVLLLVITISMILLAITNLFKPMQSFLQNYMGTYVACLLSSGELPAIRTQNTLGANESRCNFSIPKGNGTIANNGSNRSGGNGGGRNNENDGSDSGSSGRGGSGSRGSSKDSKSKSGSDSAKDSSVSGQGSYAGSRSTRSGFGRRGNTSNRDLSTSDGDMAGGGGKRYVNNLEGKGDRFFQNRQGGSSGRSRMGRGIALSGMTKDENEKVERKIQAQSRRLPSSREEFSAPGKKNVLKPPPPVEAKAVKQEDPGFTIGNLFKYIFIAVILLLIIILGGGQAFEMSKTMD